VSGREERWENESESGKKRVEEREGEVRKNTYPL
jgi:hypothetical protein